MDIREQLIRDEGLILHAYQDSLGYWTIGVGRLIDKRKAGSITKEEALHLLDNDIERISNEIFQALPWAVDLMHNDEARFAVLVNMAFNLGINGLMQFKKTLGLIESANYSAAADEMLKSKWSAQVGQRAIRMAQQMHTAVWH